LTEASQLLTPTRHTVIVDGGLLSYQEAGPPDGPVVLLLHGLLSESTTWQPTIEPLARLGLHVIALDLVGHGESDKPPLAYYLDDFAASVSALLTHLELGPVTLAGHSLGGAIAMEFAHTYPDQIARLVLVASGGLGTKVHLILRVATLPGSGVFLRAMVNRRTAWFYARPQLHRALRLPPESVVNLARMGRSLLSHEGRSTFVTAVRAVITPTGQIGDMVANDFVRPELPTLIIWSKGDPIIPARHAIRAHERLPNSRLDLFEGATHEPHRREPDRFAAAVAAFIDETDPAP
jgi:pimeloyl-ACP methyl ester carboxylesterase